MSGLTQARADLAEQLRASGIHVDDHVPDQVSPPCVLIEPGDPYMTYGDTYDPDQITVCLDVYVLVAHQSGANEWMANELDKALTLLYPLLGDWIIARTGKPGIQYTGEWMAYGIRLSVETLTSNEGATA